MRLGFKVTLDESSVAVSIMVAFAGKDNISLSPVPCSCPATFFQEVVAVIVSCNNSNTDVVTSVGIRGCLQHINIMRKIPNCLGRNAGWDTQFSEGKRVKYFDVRKVWRDWYEEASSLGDEDEESRTDPDDADGEGPSMIQEFMRGLQGSYICQLEATTVENFCSSDLLESLCRDGKGILSDLHENRNIWFAGSCLGVAESSTLQPRWLTPQNFYREFRKHVSHALSGREERLDAYHTICSVLTPRLYPVVAGGSMRPGGMTTMLVSYPD